MRQRSQPWTPAEDDMLRRIYADNAHNKKLLSEALSFFEKRVPHPRYMVIRRALELGITVERRRPWTHLEIAILREFAGIKPVPVLMKELGRSHTAVVSKMEKLQLSKRVTEGYSRENLQLLFGVYWKTVQMWIKNGWLRIDPTTNRVPERSVIKFIHSHPEEYSFRRVDETWFKGMLFPFYGLNVIGRVSKDCQSAEQHEYEQEVRA
jgi:hypothetical protein